jgi:hypothetical protein
MNRSEAIGQLADALAKAQGKIGAATKDEANPHFRSHFASLASIWQACRAALAANGLAVMQFPRAAGGVVEVETVLTHSSGEWVSDVITLPASKGDAQGIGSAITYGKRYALAAIVGVYTADEDDDGEGAVGRDHAATQPRHDAKPASGPPKNGKPQEGRGKVADSVCAAVSQAKSLAELKSALSLVPKGFADAKDDHYARIVAAKDARKLSLTRDEIDAVAKQLNYDWAKLALAASACDIPNLETMTADEAGKLLESLKADAKEVARASV